MMEVQTESRSLVPIRGVPMILGGFHLDDHNVEEWSDSTNPALQHRAREEKGKWINPEKNADIQFQKREDNKKFEGGEEKERTEVIEGKSPDSNFQIIRTHREFQGGENNSGNSRTTSSSTSYQMSSSRGMRSTVKTTSNRTTSKTVSVSGGRTDDFETLKMSFQPLDNSTQRERINMSRSGTMGIRRPPTKMVRRHNPPAAMEETEETEVMTPPSEISRTNHQDSTSTTSGLSIMGYKNLSPKIRVGFPVEIQLELQTKLRVSSTAAKATTEPAAKGTSAEEDGSNRSHQHTTRLNSSVANHDHNRTSTTTTAPSTPLGNLEEMEMDLEQRGRTGGINSSNDSAIPLSFTNNKISNNGHSTFDFSQQERRKSYGFESIAQSRYHHHNNNNYNATKQIQSTGMKESSPLPAVAPIRNSPSPHVNGSIPPMLDHEQKPTPLTSLSRSWDLIQNVANSNRASSLQQGSTTEIDELSSTKGSLSKTVVRNNEKYDWDEGSVGGESDEELQREFTFDSLEDSSAKRKSSSVIHIESESPDVTHNEMNSPSLISPASERSRKLMKILDETPDLLNKMSFRNYFSGSPSQSFKSEPNPRNGWKNDGNHSEFEDHQERRTSGSEMGDWERQKRQLNFLSDSLNRILDSSPNDNHDHAEKLNAQLTSEFSQNGSQGISPEPTTNGSHFSELEGVRKQFGIDDGLLDNNELYDYNSNTKRPSPRVSQTWIFSGDFDKPIQQVRDQDVTTTISATYDSFRKPLKKVEFCKTEVHFTADSGKFHIVETDENKPSTVHLYRRKRRSEKKAMDLLKSLGLDGLDKSVSGGQTNEKSSTDTGVNSTHLWSEQEQQITQSYSEKFSDASALLRPGEFSSKIERKFNESDEKINLVEKSNNNRLMMNLNLNLALDVGDMHEYDDDNRSPSHNILSNYGELKIQRYLKQLTSPSSLSHSETSETSMDPEMNHNMGDSGEKDSAQHRFDNNVLYENGSFVPMATRKSLIEMNNRKRSNQASHTSDQSSTASNYSLPNSDGNPTTTSNENLKLTTMEATVRTAGPKPPQITSVQLRYSLDNDEEIGNRKNEAESYPPKPYMPDPIIVPQLTRETNRNEETGKAFQRHIPFAVMPPEMSNPPYRNDPYYHSPSRSPSKSPTRHNAAFRNPKPPTPILPIQFSTFEKSGAALRERFYSKKPSCGCTNGAESDSAAVPAHSLLGDNHGLSSHRYSTPPRQITSGSSQSKSVVTINTEDKYGKSNFVKNNGTSADIGRKRNASSDNTNHLTQNNQRKDEERSVTSTPEPVLSMDHTWKGPAHFESQVSPKGTSLTRSMTFPKSTRPEPEWVSKARSREARVTDWNLVGKAYGSTRKSEPPWISELRIKNKTNSNEEIKSLPKISIVYPWQRNQDSYLNEKDELGPSPVQAVQPELKPVAPKFLRPFVLKKEKGKEISQTDKLTSWKSAHSELSNNKSIVDLNRDSDSILINPPQIEVKPLATKHKAGTKTKHFSSGHSKVSPAPEEISQDSRNPTSMKGFNSVDDSMCDSISSTRKPLQASTINNKTYSTSNSNNNNNTNNSIGKSKPPPKPPKPPQRTSSLVKCQTTGFSASLEKKPPTSRRVINHSNSEDSPGSSRSNTPIHRHPTIKISKMPLKTAASPDGKLNPSKNKTKAHVSSTSEAKRSGNTKAKDSSVEPKLAAHSNVKIGSPIQNQNQSPSPSGGRATWSNSIKTQQARQGSPGAPSIKKLT